MLRASGPTPLAIEDGGPPCPPKADHPEVGARRAPGGGTVARRYRSPSNGELLRADTPHSLTDGEARWPVIDAIPYLRAGSEARAAEAVAQLDAGRADDAAALLLAENDPWWDEAPPPHEDLRAVVRGREALSLRDAMARLGWGRVGDYFAHRWSDPTYLAGLTVLDRHWCAPRSAFELACGIGHYLRALTAAGAEEVAGADVVFGKLWVARHWVCPEARLVCFDAEADVWPTLPDADLVTCHDAFYFLRNKAAVAERLRGGARRLYAVPHVHNAEAATYSSGAAVTAGALAALFPDAVMYDDAELTRAGASGTAPRALSPRRAGGPDPAKRSEGGAASSAPAASTPLASGGTGHQPEALSLVGGPALHEPSSPSPLLRPADGTPLVRNPLLTGDGVAWPSPRYRDEYGPLATYGRAGPVSERAAMSEGSAPLVRTRDLLDLPPRW